MLSVSVKSKLIAGVAAGAWLLLRSPVVLVRGLKGCARVCIQRREEILHLVSGSSGLPALIPFRNNQAALPVRRTPVVSFLSVNNKRTCLSVMSLPRNHGVGTSHDHACSRATAPAIVYRLEPTRLSSHQKRQHWNWEEGCGDHRRPQSRD